MFLRSTRRKKDGKDHRFFSMVESHRLSSGQMAHDARAHAIGQPSRGVILGEAQAHFRGRHSPLSLCLAIRIAARRGALAWSVWFPKSVGPIYAWRNAYLLVIWAVLVSYRDKRTRAFATGKRVKAFSGLERSARLKLDRLEAATSLRDLAALPGNRFEALVGDRKDQFSIRSSDQWRICFEWADRAPGPSNVGIVDYH